MTLTEEAKYKDILAEVKNEKLAFDLYLQWKCLTDLYFLGAEVLDLKKKKDKTGRRRRVDPKFHRWLAHVLELPEDKLILIPRDHCKSTWVKVRIVQLVLKDPYVKIGLLGGGSRLAESQLADIKNFFCTPMLRELFPDIIPDPGNEYRNWDKCTGSMLTLRRDKDKAKGIQSEQITAVGEGAKITGHHWDYIFADDIVDKDTVNTPEQMKKAEEWWEYIQPMIEVDGEIIMTGTPYHYNDLYAKIMRERQFKHERIYKRPAISQTGEILYSSWYSKTSLEKKRIRMTPYTFSCQYLINPRPKEDQIFPTPQPTYHSLPADDYSYYITIDPAATTESYSDETGMVIAAVNKINMIYIVEALGFKKKGNEIAELLIQKCMKYKPKRVGIEFGLQEHLRYIIQERKNAYEAKHKVNISVLNNLISIPISRKMSKGKRINWTLGGFVREGKFLVSERCSDLIHEMDHFTGKGNEKDNLVDACSMLFAVIENFSHKYWWRPVPENFQYGWTFMDLTKDEEDESWRNNFKHVA